MSIELPAYETLKQDGSFEIRRYNGYLLARVDVSGDFDTALNEGFRVLFDFISGRNKVSARIPMTVPVTEEAVEVSSERIRMTTPVTIEPAGLRTYRISFIMPGEYTPDTVPRPDDPGIYFEEVPDRTVAVVRFPGHAHEAKMREKMQELEAWLNRSGLASRSPFRLARYDPPWIPGFLRHNEVAVDV